MGQFLQPFHKADSINKSKAVGLSDFDLQTTQIGHQMRELLPEVLGNPLKWAVGIGLVSHLLCIIKHLASSMIVQTKHQDELIVSDLVTSSNFLS